MSKLIIGIGDGASRSGNERLGRRVSAIIYDEFVNPCNDCGKPVLKRRRYCDECRDRRKNGR